MIVEQRYRIGEVTGHSPTDPRDSFVLRTALVVARLRDWREPPNGAGRIWQ